MENNLALEKPHIAERLRKRSSVRVPGEAISCWSVTCFTCGFALLISIAECDDDLEPYLSDCRWLRYKGNWYCAHCVIGGRVRPRYMKTRPKKKQSIRPVEEDEDE